MPTNASIHIAICVQNIHEMHIPSDDDPLGIPAKALRNINTCIFCSDHEQTTTVVSELCSGFLKFMIPKSNDVNDTPK